RHLKNTVYDRGGSGTNPKEAQRIAREVWVHYRDHPHLSLAVATFSVRQKEAVEAEVMKQRRRHPELTAKMVANKNEPFMVRNLENLQGDERDVIMVSMGYGFDSEGRLSLSFGPLNRDGGERRLNVLMTRARHSCMIFSNFRASDMRLKPDTPAGVRHLQTFLQYAESKRMFLEDFEPSDDPLVNSVADFLRSRGANVDVNIGNPGYRIDIAVRSPDGSRHLVAVLLDGPRYQALERTRDRDRLWESMLRNLGWQTLRVWCQDWYSDPEGARSRLWEKVHVILSSYTPPDTTAVRAVLEENGDDTDAGGGDALLESLMERGPMHPDLLLQEYRRRRGRSRITPSLRKELQIILETAMAKGELRQEDGFYMLPIHSREAPVPELDRSDWDPEWVPPWQYRRILEASGEQLENDNRVDLMASSLHLKKGKRLKAHLDALFPADGAPEP
ncbi:MAG: AAA domain-containing protein, partial [Candidatus Methanomethylophilaceae archaeon]|nr:AAA domain-containing protein [Candidatus Methanomethylophilaceae archaeon]